MHPRTVTAGSRGSALARWQTTHVLERLLDAWPGLETRTRIFTTRGDANQTAPLPQIGGKGLFTLELEEALRAGDIDLAVHSLKDLPTEDAPGLVVGAVLRRAAVVDALVAPAPVTLDTLPEGAVVGTSSLRRTAQLRHRRPDLRVEPIRGNIDTRVRKVVEGPYDAGILAAAGLVRLGLTDHIVARLGLDVMLPAPGQGALAVQCRDDDDGTRALLAALDDRDTRRATDAERHFLTALGGGCAVPVAAFAETRGDDVLHLTGMVAAVDGSRVIRLTATGADPAELGRRLAEEALASGAAEVLAHV